MNASARPNHRAHVQTTARPPRMVFNLGVQTGKNSCPEPAKVVVAEHCEPRTGARRMRLLDKGCAEAPKLSNDRGPPQTPFRT